MVTTGKVTSRLDRNVERGSSDNLDCGDKGRLERDHGCSQRCPTERCVAAEKAGEHVEMLRSAPLNLYLRGSWMSISPPLPSPYTEHQLNANYPSWLIHMKRFVRPPSPPHDEPIVPAQTAKLDIISPSHIGFTRSPSARPPQAPSGVMRSAGVVPGTGISSWSKVTPRQGHRPRGAKLNTRYAPGIRAHGWRSRGRNEAITALSGAGLCGGNCPGAGTAFLGDLWSGGGTSLIRALRLRRRLRRGI